MWSVSYVHSVLMDAYSASSHNIKKEIVAWGMPPLHLRVRFTKQRHKLYLISMFVTFSFFCCCFGLFRAGRITIQFFDNRQNMFVSRAQFYFVICHILRLISTHVIIIYFFTNHQMFLKDTFSSNGQQSYFLVGRLATSTQFSLQQIQISNMQTRISKPPLK